MTVETITLGPWDEKRAEPAAWYEPLVDQAGIDVGEPQRAPLGKEALTADRLLERDRATERPVICRRDIGHPAAPQLRPSPSP